MIEKPIHCPYCNNRLVDPYEEMMKESPEIVPEHVVSCYCKWSLPLINFSVSLDPNCDVKWFVIQNKIAESSFISIRVDVEPPKCVVQMHGARDEKFTLLVLEESFTSTHLSIKEAMEKLFKYKRLKAFA